MDYSQLQQASAPAMQPVETNQTAIDAYYASYYAYYAPSLNTNSNSISDLQTLDSSSASTIPPPPGVVDAHSSVAVTATTPYVTVDTTPYVTLDNNAQSLAWREAVRMYGTDPLPITGAGATEQPHSIYPDFSWTGHIVQAQLPQFVSSKKQSKKAKVVQSAYCEVCKVDCNSPSVFEQHKLGKKHLKNLEKLCLPLPSNTCSFTGPTVAVPLIGPQENPFKSKARKKGAESIEDLESKRRKVMACGATNESIRVCRICNVVCNSDKVYYTHLAGQKHAAKAAKASVNA